MDGADATAAALGAWASIRGFFTPATLFLVVNLVIGTIALTSRSHQRRRRGYSHDDDAQHQEPLHQVQQPENQYYQQNEQYVPPPPAPLARTSSVLDRLRSIGLYRFRSGDFPPEYAAAAATDPQAEQAHYSRSWSEPAPVREEKSATPPRMKKSSSEVRKAGVARAPARVVEAAVLEEEDVVDGRAEEFTDNLTQPLQDFHYQEEYVPPPAPAPLAGTSSVLDRLRSFSLYRFRSGDFPPEYAAAAANDSQGVITPVDEEMEQSHYTRSRSETAPVREKKRATPSRMKKSSSEVRKAEVARASARVVEAAVLEEEDVVDARADEFTDNFTQQPPPQQEVYYQEEYVPPLRPAPLARTSSVLDRLRSFSLYSFRSGDVASEHDAAAAAAAEEKQAQAAHYSRSRSEPAREQNKKDKKQQLAADARMTKSSSEARKPAAAAPSAAQEDAEAESVDARADNFINSFRQQLQLQRLNSLLNRGAK